MAERVRPWPAAARAKVAVTPRSSAVQRMPVEAMPLAEAPPIVHEVRRSPGEPLDAATRAVVEARLGHDFSRVRVHTHGRATEASRAVGSRAYTIGDDVVFAAGQYEPGTAAGRRLLAHEMVHVVQQRRAPAAARGESVKIGAPDDAAEREADRLATRLVDPGGALGLGTPSPSSRTSGPMHGPPATAPPSSASPTTAMRVRWPVVPSPSAAGAAGTLQRQPAKTTTVSVGGKGTDLPLGKGGSGGIVSQYPARARKEPIDDKAGAVFDIDLPLLVYPPATLKPPTVDVFVFFHGMRADYREGGNQGTEPIALWTHLQEAVAGTGRVGIAPQAPRTWRQRQTWDPDPADPKKKIPGEKVWEKSTAQWREALDKVGFDGLIKIALDGLARDLEIPTLKAGTIHVSGHSAGGLGIIEATEFAGGAPTQAAKVQDLTLQDAGYNFGYQPVVDWLLEDPPGKTVRVLISEGEQADTRNAMKLTFNVAEITKTITGKKLTDTFEVNEVKVPDPSTQKPRPGGFVLESHLIVKNTKKGVTQATIVAFFAPGGGHYETTTATMNATAAAGPSVTTDFLGEATPGQYRVLTQTAGVFADKEFGKPAMITVPSGRASRSKPLELARDAQVEVVALEMATPKGARTPRYAAKVKVAGVEGWMALARLTPIKKP